MKIFLFILCFVSSMNFIVAKGQISQVDKDYRQEEKDFLADPFAKTAYIEELPRVLKSLKEKEKSDNSELKGAKIHSIDYIRLLDRHKILADKKDKETMIKMLENKGKIIRAYFRVPGDKEGKEIYYYFNAQTSEQIAKKIVKNKRPTKAVLTANIDDIQKVLPFLKKELTAEKPEFQGFKFLSLEYLMLTEDHRIFAIPVLKKKLYMLLENKVEVLRAYLHKPGAYGSDASYYFNAKTGTFIGKTFGK